MSENIDSLRRAYEGFAKRDLDTVLSVMSSDIEWDATDALAHTGVFHGHEGVSEYIRGLARRRLLTGVERDEEGEGVARRHATRQDSTPR